MVRLVLEYDCAIWNHYYVLDIDHAFVEFAEHVFILFKLCINKNSYPERLKRVGFQSLQTRRQNLCHPRFLNLQ